MHYPIAQLLKKHTAGTHDQVEASLGLLDPELSAARLHVVVSRFAGFWPGIERLVDDWAAVHPHRAVELGWPRRRRTENLHRDLARFGLTATEVAALPQAPAPFASVDEAELFGWLYVSEGATLGGAVIDRAMRSSRGRAGEAPTVPLATFTPYAEGPGPMWRAYLSDVQGWVGEDHGRSAAVVQSAQTAFSALADWLAPIALDAAA